MKNQIIVLIACFGILSYSAYQEKTEINSQMAEVRQSVEKSYHEYAEPSTYMID